MTSWAGVKDALEARAPAAERWGWDPASLVEPFERFPVPIVGHVEGAFFFHWRRPNLYVFFCAQVYEGLTVLSPRFSLARIGPPVAADLLAPLFPLPRHWRAPVV